MMGAPGAVICNGAAGSQLAATLIASDATATRLVIARAMSALASWRAASGEWIVPMCRDDENGQVLGQLADSREQP